MTSYTSVSISASARWKPKGLTRLLNIYLEPKSGQLPANQAILVVGNILKFESNHTWWNLVKTAFENSVTKWFWTIFTIPTAGYSYRQIAENSTLFRWQLFGLILFPLFLGTFWCMTWLSPPVWIRSLKAETSFEGRQRGKIIDGRRQFEKNQNIFAFCCFVRRKGRKKLSICLLVIQINRILRFILEL